MSSNRRIEWGWGVLIKPITSGDYVVVSLALWTRNDCKILHHSIQQKTLIFCNVFWPLTLRTTVFPCLTVSVSGRLYTPDIEVMSPVNDLIHAGTGSNQSNPVKTWFIACGWIPCFSDHIVNLFVKLLTCTFFDVRVYNLWPIWCFSSDLF